MPVYIVIESTTKDAEAYGAYIERVPPIIAKYGGRYLVRGGEITPGAGDWTPERIIILEFPSREHITRCFSSPEYREIAPLHDAGAEYRSVIVGGYAPDAV
jgi:uncharacterized protein (DUF1330 family)